MTTLVLTVIGTDRAGLVDALSGAIANHGGNWDRSHMAHLAGKFAGIVVVTVPDRRTADLLAALGPLQAEGALHVTAETADAAEDAPAAGARLALDVVGHDRPGIVHEISHALATRDVSIEELETETRSAPMANEPLFEARAVLRAPADVSFDDLRSALEEIANELMVDIALHADVESADATGRG